MCANWDSLPEEMQLEIFSWLQHEVCSVVMCRWTCHSWRRILPSPLVITNAADAAMNSAASLGYLEILKYLCAQGYRMDMLTFNAAVRGDHIHVLEWLLDKHIIIDTWRMADPNNSRMLRFLMSLGYTPHYDTLDSMSKHGTYTDVVYMLSGTCYQDAYRDAYENIKLRNGKYPGAYILPDLNQMRHQALYDGNYVLTLQIHEYLQSQNSEQLDIAKIKQATSEN